MSGHDRPTPAELLEAVREFLEVEILPLLDDHRLRFRTLVAINGLGIAQRELESSEDPGDPAALLERVRAGQASIGELKEHVAAKLRVANPAYLERYGWRRRMYLMRHAQVAYFGEDGRPVGQIHVPLTEVGREQARAARETLAGIAFDRVVSSDLLRTQETARIVSGVEPDVWPDFHELRAGRTDEIPEDELEFAFMGVFRGPVPEDMPFLGGETIGQLLDRILPAVDRLVADESWENALVVLHGGVNRGILSYALTGGRAFLGGIEQTPACINVLDVGPDEWVVRTVGYTPYDPLHAELRATTMEEMYDLYLRYRATQAEPG